MSAQDTSPYYFLHIPKTAGTSVIDWLGRTGQFRMCPHQLWSALISVDRRSLAEYDLFYGHFYRALEHFLGTGLRTFTFLREPVARAYSHYRHALREPEHYFHVRAREAGSFLAFMQDPLARPLVSNFQTRSLSSGLDPAELWRTRGASHERFWLERQLETASTGLSVDEAVERATAFLDECLFVGIVERMDESLGRLATVLGLTEHEAAAQLNAGHHTSGDGWSQQELDLAREINRADYELYTLAFERFSMRPSVPPADESTATSSSGGYVNVASQSFVSYAQNFEDVLLHRALAHVQRGFYVDVGAQDPLVDSVSRAFYERGWRGVHVEPSPAWAAKLRSERPDERVVQAAVASHDGSLRFYEFPDTGLSTADAAIAGRHVQAGFAVREIEVPCVSLDTLLAPYRERDIHWLKIDAEGYESEVLAGWTARTPRPWIVVVESTLPLTQQQSSAGWQDRLSGLGYEHAYFDGLNRFFVSVLHPALMDAFRAPPNVFDRFALSGTATSTFADELKRNMQALRSEHERLAAQLQSSLNESLAEMGELRRQLAAERQRVQETGDRLTESTEKIGTLERDMAGFRARTDVLERAYSAIANSRSWRLTLPLRIVAGYARRVLGRVDPVAPAAPPSRLPITRHVVLSALARLHERPQYKRRIVRIVRRVPALDRWLRSQAHGHVALAPRVAAPALGDPLASRETSAADSRDLARRMRYLTALEDRLDRMEEQHRREIERLKQKLDASGGGRTASASDSASVDVEL